MYNSHRTTVNAEVLTASYFMQLLHVHILVLSQPYYQQGDGCILVQQWCNVNAC